MFCRPNQNNQFFVIWDKVCFDVSGKKQRNKPQRPSTLSNSKNFDEHIQMTDGATGWCPEICARALFKYELSNSSQYKMKSPKFLLVLQLILIHLWWIWVRMLHVWNVGSSLSVAGHNPDNPAQKAVSVILQRTEAPLIQRSFYLCMGQGF